MATFDYDRMANKALELLTKFGRSDLALRERSATGDAWDPTIANSDTEVLGVVIDYSLSEQAGGLVQANDKRVLLSPDSTVVPTTAMQLVIDDVPYEIVSVITTNPAGTVQLYELQVRL